MKICATEECERSVPEDAEYCERCDMKRYIERQDAKLKAVLCENGQMRSRIKELEHHLNPPLEEDECPKPKQSLTCQLENIMPRRESTPVQ